MSKGHSLPATWPLGRNGWHVFSRTGIVRAGVETMNEFQV